MICGNWRHVWSQQWNQNTNQKKSYACHVIFEYDVVLKTHSAPHTHVNQEMSMISTSRSVRVSLWQIGILGTHAMVLISCGDQFSVCIEQPTLSSNQYNPQLRPIWWSPHICQSDNYIEAEPKEEEWRIAYHVKQYVVFHCLVTGMNMHLIQRLSVRLRTPNGPPTHIRTWLSIQWMPLPFTTIGN